MVKCSVATLAVGCTNDVYPTGPFLVAATIVSSRSPVRGRIPWHDLQYERGYSSESTPVSRAS